MIQLLAVVNRTADDRRVDNNTTVDANFVVQIYNCF